MPDRRRQRGFVTIETLIVSFVATLAIAQVGPFAPPENEAERMSEAEHDAWRLRYAAELQLAVDGRCPTAESLLAAGEFRAERDPWAKPYWVFCQEGRATVVSDGPDGEPFTSDDVAWEPVAWSAAARRHRAGPGSSPGSAPGSSPRQPRGPS